MQYLGGSKGRGASVLLSGNTAMPCDGGALRDSRSAGTMFGNGYPLLCGRMCVRRVTAECARVRPTVLGSASTKRFLFLIMPKRRDCAKLASASTIDLNMQ